MKIIIPALFMTLFVTSYSTESSRSFGIAQATSRQDSIKVKNWKFKNDHVGAEISSPDLVEKKIGKNSLVQSKLKLSISGVLSLNCYDNVILNIKKNEDDSIEGFTDAPEYYFEVDFLSMGQSDSQNIELIENACTHQEKKRSFDANIVVKPTSWSGSWKKAKWEYKFKSDGKVKYRLVISLSQEKGWNYNWVALEDE